ncbi:helix-turn-helix domain-containing protein [Streptomyces sp. G6]|uniref:helix-turn-helix domain-containing protein n=1 Tax=Streptomyces sp. G6 TaxID=1178736 RepID=UPI003ED8BBC0
MSTSSSIQQAREALGKRLLEIRKDSGLTARELAFRAGWHESKCSRIENGRTPPSDVRRRTHCGWTARDNGCCTHRCPGCNCRCGADRRRSVS